MAKSPKKSPAPAPASNTNGKTKKKNVAAPKLKAGGRAAAGMDSQPECAAGFSPHHVYKGAASQDPASQGDTWDGLPAVQRRRQERMTHIDEWLQKIWHGAPGMVPLKSAKVFAQELGKGVDAIYGDIREMIDVHRLPIEYDNQRHGYFYTQEVASSPFLQLSNAELLAFCLAERFIAAIKGMPILPDLQSALRKIVSLFGKRLAFDPARVAELFTFVPSGHAAKVDPEHWHTVSRALLMGTQLDFNYTKVHGDGAGVPEDKAGHPVQMVYFDGAFYVVNWDPRRADYRNYQLGRFNSATDTGAKFPERSDFNRGAYLRSNFGPVFTSGKTRKVVLHFHPRVKQLVHEREWHDTKVFSELPNGVLVLTMEVACTPDLVDWIGGYYNDCRVVSPPELRDEVARLRREAVEERGWDELSDADADADVRTRSREDAVAG